MNAERKLIQLPGTAPSVEVVLHRTLNKLDRIKSVTIVIQWDDDTLDADWSTMKTSELAMAALVLNKTGTDAAMGEDE